MYFLFAGYDIYDNCDDKDQTVDLMYPGIGKENRECTLQKSNSSYSEYAGNTSISFSNNLDIFQHLTKVG